MKKFRTATGEEHGLMETIANSVQDNDFKNLSEKNRKAMIDKKKSDLEIVNVRYQNLTNQKNGKLDVPYADYASEPMRIFRFLHDCVYKVPKGLARKVNGLGMPKRSGLVDTQGQDLKTDGEIERTHQLIPASDF